MIVDGASPCQGVMTRTSKFVHSCGILVGSCSSRTGLTVRERRRGVKNKAIKRPESSKKPWATISGNDVSDKTCSSYWVPSVKRVTGLCPLSM
jgi:hypothetical protein